MEVMRFKIKKEFSIDEAWEYLEAAGLELLYSEEDELEGNSIYAKPLSLIEPYSFEFVEKISNENLSDTSWEEQWALHSEGLDEGLLHIDLGLIEEDLHETLKLIPGPGFGNLSHPSTRLILEMMYDVVPEQDVIDIGSGSGILALAAISMGAAYAYGLEIDEEIVDHAKKNAEINGMTDETTFLLSHNWTPPESLDSAVILMNMIRSEQVDAWNSMPQIHKLPGLSLISGILLIEKDIYLDITENWGWALLEERQEGEWMAFKFRRG